MVAVGIDSLVAAASAGRKLLLLFDFDGTLSPTVSRPEQARLPASMWRILANLAAWFQVGVISSRSLTDLQHRIGIPGVWLAGSGGLEMWIEERPVGAQRMESGVTTIAAHARDLAPAIGRLPGAWLEQKPLGLTIHHRGASPATVTAIRMLAAGLRARATDVRVTMCSLGVEIVPFPEVHKGTAVSEFIRAVGDESPGLLYAGNDLNDAEAMAEVARRGGWVIAVGDGVHLGHTQVSTPSDLCELLAILGSALGCTMR
jgi:trehalose-phosphatase